MTDLNLNELRRIAEAAVDNPATLDYAFYIGCFTPKRIATLLAELEAVQHVIQQARFACCDVDAHRGLVVALRDLDAARAGEDGQ